MGTTKSSLKEKRRFGEGDAVPIASLSTDGRRGNDDGRRSDELAAEVFNDPTLIVRCPIENVMCPASDCQACKAFCGFGKIEVRGEVSVESRLRMMCGFPMSRKVKRVAAKADDNTKAKLKHHYENRRTKTNALLANLEREMFVDQLHLINCPIQKANAGDWLVVGPPCLVCDYYCGLNTHPELGVRVTCNHRRALRLVRISMGVSDGSPE